MYQKILDEAIIELKETEFPELLEEQTQKTFVRDCTLETDMELLIPDEYVNHITERLNLYKELDSLETEDALILFQERMIDRFGPIPVQTSELFNAVRLRWLAKEIGFEKIILKNRMMTGYFITNPESPYYQSENFTRVLQYVQTNPRLCSMKEGNERLSLTFKTVQTLENGLKVFRTVLGIE